MKRKARVAVADCGHHVKLPRAVDVDCAECDTRDQLRIEQMHRLAMAWLTRDPGCQTGCQCQPCKTARHVAKKARE